MADLSANANYRYSTPRTTNKRSFVVENAEVIYKHAFVATDAGGYLDSMDDVAGTRFVGLALEKKTGDTSAAPPVECRVECGGVLLHDVSVTGASAVTDNNSLVFASDDATLTLTTATNAKAVGYVDRWVSGTTCDVQLFSAEEHAALY